MTKWLFWVGRCSLREDRAAEKSGSCVEEEEERLRAFRRPVGGKLELYRYGKSADNTCS